MVVLSFIKNCVKIGCEKIQLELLNNVFLFKFNWIWNTKLWLHLCIWVRQKN